MKASADVVKRWVNEVQETVQSKEVMVQYHALGLLYQIKQHDRLAVSKLVSSMIKSSVRSQYAHCLLIKYTAQVVEEDPNNADRTLFDYLESCLRHKSEIVMFEAARTICRLKNATSRELTPAITVLQLFLSSPKPTLRFAAVRTLNKLAMTQPLAVTTCNLDMENLITDVNRSIATLAITTLLKTGSEFSVDRLMKQISNFMAEISDEFKIVVVDAIRTLCLKFPQKHRALMSFLSNILRDEGGFEYKKAIVDTILIVINDIPESKELGLTHLCEFIEDCEFTFLSTKILHLLGKEGPSTSTPSKFIRYIYNRVILENSQVRASAVFALAKFAVKLDYLRPKVMVLLKRCLHDNDDEVRDRVTFYLKMLEHDPQAASAFINEEFTTPLANLEAALLEYATGNFVNAFDLSSVSLVVEQPKETKATGPAGHHVPGPKPSGSGALAKEAASVSDIYNEALSNIPQFASYGKLFRSSKPAELTEAELEYVVNCVKHVFPQHVVFQFNGTNTLEDQLLENVVVKVDSSNVKGVKLDAVVPAVQMPYSVSTPSYVSFRTQKDAFPTGTFSNVMKFTVKEVDPSSGQPDEGGYDDEYQLEDLELTTSDYMQRTVVANFQQEWDATDSEHEVVETYSLSTMKTLTDAVKEITEFLGMSPCDGTEAVPEKKTKHILLLSGTFLGGVRVLARARMRIDPSQTVSMELTVRSPDPQINAAVASAI